MRVETDFPYRRIPGNLCRHSSFKELEFTSPPLAWLLLLSERRVWEKGGKESLLWKTWQTLPQPCDQS